MAIILEGPDCSGKTTLAKHLVTKFTLGHRKVTAKGELLFPTALAQALLVDEVVDRWWMTDDIYAQVHQRDSTLLDVERWQLCLTAARSGSSLCVLLPSLQTLLERLRARGDEEIDEAKMAQVHRLYQHFPFEDWFRPVFNGSCSIRTTWQMEQLAQCLRDLHVFKKNLNFYRWEGTGTLEQNQVLLIGDQRNLKRGGTDETPFMTRKPVSSGNTLFKILRGAGLSPWQVHLHNAYDRAGRAYDLQGLAEYLLPRQIVSLGRKAHVQLQKFGLPHLELPHPQWIRRFDGWNLEHYAQILKEGIRC